MTNQESKTMINELTSLLTERQQMQVGSILSNEMNDSLNLEYIKMCLADWMHQSKELTELISGRVAVIRADIDRMKEIK